MSEHKLIFTPYEDDDWRCSAGDWVNRYGDDPDVAHRTHRAALSPAAPPGSEDAGLSDPIATLVAEIEKRRIAKRAQMASAPDPRGWGLTFQLRELEELLGLPACPHPEEDRSTLPPIPRREDLDGTQRCDRCGAIKSKGVW